MSDNSVVVAAIIGLALFFTGLLVISGITSIHEQDCKERIRQAELQVLMYRSDLRAGDLLQSSPAIK